MYATLNSPSERSTLLTCLFLLAGLLSLMPQAARSQSIPTSPLAAEEALSHFELHPDCRIELVAAEPDVIDPVAIAFAPDGKLWVVEYSDYPNGPPENGPPLSRIRTLTDADGDGRYTDAVTFADKLLFANGLMFWQDGVIVTSDGAVVFMRDTDGDGKADEQVPWFQGFKRENPQLRANHPTLALDGHIYVASGLRGGEVISVRQDWPASPKPTAPPSNSRAQDPQTSTDGKAVGLGESASPKPVSLSGRDFRFDPFTGEYESVSGPSQFGLCFDPFGNRFGCSNRNPCKHYVLEDRYLARNPYLAVSQVHEDVSPAAENSRLYPISRTWTTSNLHANQFTAACGVLIYGGDALPAFRGNSFICEPTANLVHRDVLEPKGATFTSHYGREGVEFLATRDEWFRPVNLKHGPDGALYVVDMYRAVIEHPQFMPEELKTRPDLTLGNDRGRIYRIVTKEPAARAHDSSFRTEPEQLAEHLRSPNAWHRDTAFRLLVEAGRESNDSVAKLLDQPLSTESLFAVLSLLRVNDGPIGQGFVAASQHADNRVLMPFLPLIERRMSAVTPEEFAGSNDLPKLMAMIVKAMTDQGANQQLAIQTALTVGAFPRSEERTKALGMVLERNAHDEWFRAAVASSSVGEEAELLLHMLRLWKAELSKHPEQADMLPLEVTDLFARIVGSRGAEKQVGDVLSLLESPVDSNDPAVVEGWQRVEFALLTALADGGRRGKVPPAAITGAPGVDIALKQARDWVVESTRDPKLREEALAVVAIDAAAEATQVLIDTVKHEQDQRVLTAAIAALSRKSGDQICDVLLDGFKARTPSVRSAILSAMLARTDRTSRLLDEIEAGHLSPRDIDAATATRLTRSRDAKIKQRATKLLVSSVDADRAKVIAKYQPCLSQTGDPQRGLAVFKKICATCHKMGDIGTNVGPDISDSRTKTPDFLLTNILDPNRAVDGNYFGYTILDTEGRVHTGIITSETASSVTLRIQEGKNVTLLRTDIEEMVNTGLSLMPVGVEKDITVEQMADLISFIKNWRYLDGSVPEEVIGR